MFVIPLLVGVAVHLSVRPFEIDRHTPRFIFAYLISFTALVINLHTRSGLSLAESILETATIAARFNAGLFGSILIYRAFFHRLHRFPGPLPAKLTRFYAMKIAALTLQTHLAIENVHEQYGDFVRVGPREISIKRASAIGTIYGPNSKCYRSAQYDQPSTEAAKSSIVGTRDVEAHRRRKRAWERGLGFRALDVYEPRVRSKVDLLLSRIARHEDTPLDATELAMFFSFDVLGDIGYSRDFDLLKTGEHHEAITAIREQTVYIGTLSTVPWLFSMIVNSMEVLSNIGIKTSFNIFLDWCTQQVDARRKAIHDEKNIGVAKDPQDVMSWLIKAHDEGDGSAPPGEAAFQEDSRVLMVAGSDTTSAALTNSFYYLTKYPAVYRKLQAIVDAEFPGGEADWTYTKAKAIPYLDAVIQETLRLRPSVPSGLPRVTPPGGLQIDEVFIPGDVNISVPTYTIQRDPKHWDDPLEFMPERWETLSTDKTPFFPFTRGKYACPGKNLAMMELIMVISRVALRYKMEFPSGAVVERFEKETLDTFTMALPELPLIFSRR
ncbi:hypothetical protein N0V93_000749 [Gnomoniopsis smithogilvyi]|uniref:Benzoate 4-monooxygenase cytochrome P450 n=1 Tax=Gnomoniopsis smithogilvyi TaxID=1191159 RepID=A0A9W9D1M7_9PEZI|nr:hypothetical protein N0V93_000749 [Gnomoniopsis smithogilvyi]